MKPNRALKKYGSEIQTLNENNIDSFVKQTYELYKDFWIHIGNEDGKVKFFYRFLSTDKNWENSYKNSLNKMHVRVTFQTSNGLHSNILGMYCDKNKESNKIKLTEFSFSLSQKNGNVSSLLLEMAPNYESKFLFLPNEKGLYLNRAENNREGKSSLEVFMLK